MLGEDFHHLVSIVPQLLECVERSEVFVGRPVEQFVVSH